MDQSKGQLAMSDTAAQLALLKANYANGVLCLEQGGEKVTFDTGDEMRRRIRDLVGQLALHSGGSASTGIHYPAFTKCL